VAQPERIAKTSKALRYLRFPPLDA